jgi:uncharacterized protein
VHNPLISVGGLASGDAISGPSNERIVLLDALRGFALYGVLLGNTVDWFSGRTFPMIAAPPENRADRVVDFLLNVFVHGRAMSLLSFLFGLGFSMQIQRAEAAGRSVAPMYLRRLGTMFAIGVAHVVLLWWGDVLRSYAIAGVALLLFRKLGDRPLLIWAAALTLLPQMVTFHPGYSPLIDRIVPGSPDHAAFQADLLSAMRGHDYLELIRMQTLHSIRFLTWVAFPSFSWILGRFLLGYVVGRHRWLQDAPRNLPAFRRTLAWALPIGFAAFLVHPLLARSLGRKPGDGPIERILLEIFDEIATLAMTAACVAAVVLLTQRRWWSRRFELVLPLGQMPLTTYLSQSLICAFLFYGWGIGLMGHVGSAACVPITIAVFAVQIAISRAWMKRYRLGPTEWVWRSLSYAQRPKMRRMTT